MSLIASYATGEYSTPVGVGDISPTFAWPGDEPTMELTKTFRFLSSTFKILAPLLVTGPRSNVNAGCSKDACSVRKWTVSSVCESSVFKIIIYMNGIPSAVWIQPRPVVPINHVSQSNSSWEEEAAKKLHRKHFAHLSQIGMIIKCVRR